jgi:hypothetical protein
MDLGQGNQRGDEKLTSSFTTKQKGWVKKNKAKEDLMKGNEGVQNQNLGLCSQRQTKGEIKEPRELLVRRT